MNISRITFKRHFQNSWPILISLIVSLVFPFYMIHRFGDQDTRVFVLLSAALFLIFFIPQLVLHLNYYGRNKEDLIEIDHAARKIKITHKGESTSFLFDDIEFIERFMSYPFAEKRLHWFPWDHYNFSIIRLRNGSQFFVTSLLVPNLDLAIEPEKIKIKKRFYSIIDHENIDISEGKKESKEKGHV